MGNVVDAITKRQIREGIIGIFWLDQAGFAIKTALGRIIAIDPYLSNSCHRLLQNYGYGFKRIMHLLSRERILYLITYQDTRNLALYSATL